MEIGKTVYIHNRKAWRKWLEKNFQTEKEIWLISPNKASGKPKLLYNDAVEEALCFGWIDSIVKNIDEEHSAQRFSPRKVGSNWSQPNKERLRLLMKEKKIHPSVKESIEKVMKETFEFPEDILKEIQKNKIAWKNYQKFSAEYRRIRISYIHESRKRPEEFKKRLKNFIKVTAENKQIGYGGIEKYY